MQILRETPHHPRGLHVELHFRNEIRLQKLHFLLPTNIQISSLNMGAERAANELAACIGNATVSTRPPVLLRNHSAFSIKAIAHSIAQSQFNPLQHNPLLMKRTVFLLYLNDQTFQQQGEGASQLAAEIHMVMDADVPLVMVHENDVERGGCQFSKFIQVCMQPI